MHRVTKKIVTFLTNLSHPHYSLSLLRFSKASTMPYNIIPSVLTICCPRFPNVFCILYSLHWPLPLSVSRKTIPARHDAPFKNGYSPKPIFVRRRLCHFIELSIHFNYFFVPAMAKLSSAIFLLESSSFESVHPSIVVWFVPCLIEWSDKFWFVCIFTKDWWWISLRQVDPLGYDEEDREVLRIYRISQCTLSRHVVSA